MSFPYSTYLELHVHTAGQAFCSYSLDGVPSQAVPVTPVQHGLHELTLKCGVEEGKEE